MLASEASVQSRGVVAMVLGVVREIPFDCHRLPAVDLLKRELVQSAFTPVAVNNPSLPQVLWIAILEVPISCMPSLWRPAVSRCSGHHSRAVGRGRIDGGVLPAKRRGFVSSGALQAATRPLPGSGGLQGNFPFCTVAVCLL